MPTSNPYKIAVVGYGAAGKSVVDALIKEGCDVTVFLSSSIVNRTTSVRIPLLGYKAFESSQFVSRVELEGLSRASYFVAKTSGGSSDIYGLVNCLGASEDVEKSIVSLLQQTFNSPVRMVSPQKFIDESNSYKCKPSPIDHLTKNAFSNAFGKKLKTVNTELLSEGWGSVSFNVGTWFRSQSGLPTGVQVIREPVKHICYDEASGRYSINDSSSKLFDCVVLSAGAVSSAQIINESFLRAGKAVKSKLIELEDHRNIRIDFRLTSKSATNGFKADSLNFISQNMIKKMKLVVEYLFAQGLLKTSGSATCIYLDVAKTGRVDTKIQLLRFTENGRLGDKSSNKIQLNRKPGFALSITSLIDPIKIRVSNSDQYYSIKPDDINEKYWRNLAVLIDRFCEEVSEIMTWDKTDSCSTYDYLTSEYGLGLHWCASMEKILSPKDINGCRINLGSGLYVVDSSVIQTNQTFHPHMLIRYLASCFTKNLITRKIVFKRSSA